jgi:membrane fusion protein (multidrug efflux system)
MNRIDKRPSSRGDVRILIPAVLMMMSSSLAGCGDNGGTGGRNDGKIPVVEARPAVSRAMTRDIELTGSVEAVRTARIASPAQGPIVGCEIREGDVVEEGRILLTIGRQKAAEERVAAVREELVWEEEELKKIDKLVRSGAVPGERLDESRLRVAEARARLSEAHEKVEDYRIRAPWTGEVSRVFVTEGYFASPREDLVEMFDPQNLVIRFAVPERDAMIVEVGMEITASLDAYGGRTFRAKITRLYPELDRHTHTRTVEATLVEDVDTAPGMFARLIVPVETVEDAVVVPDAAIVVTPQQERIIFIVKNGKASRREVKTGIEHGHEVQITRGIAAGDSVVVSGNRKLRDGMKVRILNGG